MENAASPHNVNSEPDQGSHQAKVLKVFWAPSRKVLPCNRCDFLGLPRTLRLHQLLGCSITDTPSMKKSVHSPLQSAKLIAVNSEVKFCVLCGFVGLPRMLRLHQLLGCCASIVNVDKLNNQKMHNLSDLVIRPKIRLCKEKHCIKKEKCRVLDDHIEQNLPVVGKKSFNCNICSFKCTKEHSLKKHNLIHSDEKPYRCKICDYKCKIAGNLKSHILTHTGEKPFSCYICGYKCNRADILKQHTLTHTKEKPFSCKMCSFICSRLSTLKAHNLIHTGEKPFSCDICNYSCKRAYHLKIHNLKHTGEKPFSCDLCSYTCSRVHHLKVHNLTHTGESPFSCEICNRKFKQAGNLKQHSVTHTR